MKIKRVINIFANKQLKFKNWGHGDNYAGSTALISQNWNTHKLGLHAEILAPGKFSCPYHHHSKEEELFIS